MCGIAGIIVKQNIEPLARANDAIYGTSGLMAGERSVIVRLP
jgi:hypothetical protein